MANSSLTGFKHLDLSDQLYAGLMFIRLLGKSQFSVWEAKKITDKRRVAVKVFASRRGTGERQQDDEVKALIMLDSHESLIQYYDLLHQDVCVNHATGAIYKTIDDAKADGIDLDELDNAFLHFVVMELVKNGSLGEKYFEWSRDNRADSCFQLSRVADALCQVHRLGILHRDIKPANLFWDMNAGRVKIGDFGLAKSADSEFSPGGLTGTLAYLAPECWQSNDTPKRDVYAFAVTLYQIFTGKLPITVDSNEVLSHEAWELAHKNSERPHISLECEISYDLANAIMKAMSPELESRPEMDELRDALLKEHKRLAGKSTVPQASDYEAPAYLANKKWIVELPNFIVHPNVRTEILEEDAYWIEIHLAQESALKVMSIHEALQGSIGPFYQLAETWGHWSFAASFWHRRDDRVRLAKLWRALDRCVDDCRVTRCSTCNMIGKSGRDIQVESGVFSDRRAVQLDLYQYRLKQGHQTTAATQRLKKRKILLKLGATEESIRCFCFIDCAELLKRGWAPESLKEMVQAQIRKEIEDNRSISNAFFFDRTREKHDVLGEVVKASDWQFFVSYATKVYGTIGNIPYAIAKASPKGHIRTDTRIATQRYDVWREGAIISESGSSEATPKPLQFLDGPDSVDTSQFRGRKTPGSFGE